jgi:hypothetical protein
MSAAGNITVGNDAESFISAPLHVAVRQGSRADQRMTSTEGWANATGEADLTGIWRAAVWNDEFLPGGFQDLDIAGDSWTRQIATLPQPQHQTNNDEGQVNFEYISEDHPGFPHSRMRSLGEPLAIGELLLGIRPAGIVGAKLEISDDGDMQNRHRASR